MPMVSATAGKSTGALRQANATILRSRSGPVRSSGAPADAHPEREQHRAEHEPDDEGHPAERDRPAADREHRQDDLGQAQRHDGEPADQLRDARPPSTRPASSGTGSRPAAGRGRRRARTATLDAAERREQHPERQRRAARGWPPAGRRAARSRPRARATAGTAIAPAAMTRPSRSARPVQRRGDVRPEGGAVVGDVGGDAPAHQVARRSGRSSRTRSAARADDVQDDRRAPGRPRRRARSAGPAPST